MFSMRGKEADGRDLKQQKSRQTGEPPCEERPVPPALRSRRGEERWSSCSLESSSGGVQSSVNTGR